MRAVNKFIGLFLLLEFATSVASAQGDMSFKLSEVQTGNRRGLMDEYGERTAWVEIINSSWGTLDLGGCYLTDNRATLNPELSASQRTKLMSYIPRGDKRTDVSPKQHVVFYADGRMNLGTLHLNFALPEGKKSFIALFEGDGITLIDSVTVPGLPIDHSWSRVFNKEAHTWYWRECNFRHMTRGRITKRSSTRRKRAEVKDRTLTGGMAVMGRASFLSAASAYFSSSVQQDNGQRHGNDGGRQTS